MSHVQNDFSMGRIYPTKVDWWIGLILIFTVAVLIGSAVPFQGVLILWAYNLAPLQSP